MGVANGENGHEGGLAVGAGSDANGGGMAIEGGDNEGGGGFADDERTDNLLMLSPDKSNTGPYKLYERKEMPR